MSVPNLDLGPFRLEQLAGRGATADVWRGVHRQRGVPVAIKVLSRLRPGDAAGRRRFVHEVRTMAALDHRAIIRLHDHGRIPPGMGPELPADSLYLVMDWQPNGTLKRQLGRVTFRNARRTLSVLLDALGHAHARGVVHRDLKPANVLLGEGGPVIADFGLVFAADDGAEGKVGGTPNYMAAEQVRGDWRDFGPWTDLYALGCLTWALLTGKAPYAGFGPQRAMFGHLTGELPPFEPRVAVPDGLRAWLGRLMARAPADRFRFAADAAAALAELPDPDTDVARIPGAVPLVEDDDTLLTEDLTPLDPGDETVLGGQADRTDTPGMASEGADRTTDRPPMPLQWRRPTPPWTAHLPGCGTGLVELRVPPLSGRAKVRDLLWDRLADVVHGRGARAVIVKGAPGLGKSRLMRWLAERAHEAGQADTLLVEHAPVPSAVHGLGPIFERYLRLRDLDDEMAVDRLEGWGLPLDVAGRMVAVGRPGPVVYGSTEVVLDAETALFEAIADGLGALAAVRPLVVQLDDVQWGPDAVRLVEYVFDHRATLPVLFVLTLRDVVPGAPAGGEAEADARRTVELLGQRRGVEKFRLKPLDKTTHGAVAAARLPLTPETRTELARSTGGNPLFADEMLRHWLSADALEETADGFRLRPDRPDVRPPSLAHLWRARLDELLGDLRPDPMPALEVAAMLGTSVDEAEWRAACVAAEVDCPEAAIERLLDRGLVRRTDGRLAFDHGLLREALVDRARGGARAERWHRACADALGDGGDKVRRAAHLAAAGDPEAAIPLWLAAARERMRRNWHKDIRPAIALFDAVLTHRPADAAVLADAAVCRARLGWLATSGDDRRELDAAHDFAARAIDAAPESGAGHRAMGIVHHYRNRPLPALRQLELAIERDPADGESHGMAGRVLAETGPLDRAAHHLEEALRLGAGSVDLRIELARVRAYAGDWDRLRALLHVPDERSAQRSLADIALARFALWRGPGAGRPWTTEPPLDEPNPVAELFRAVNRGRALPRHRKWLATRAERALAGGAVRRGVLFLQSMAEIAGYTGDLTATTAAFTAAVEAGLTDRMWARYCPLLSGIAGTEAHATGIARIDARLLESEESSG